MPSLASDSDSDDSVPAVPAPASSHAGADSLPLAGGGVPPYGDYPWRHSATCHGASEDSIVPTSLALVAAFARAQQLFARTNFASSGLHDLVAPVIAGHRPACCGASHEHSAFAFAASGPPHVLVAGAP